MTGICLLRVGPPGMGNPGPPFYPSFAAGLLWNRSAFFQPDPHLSRKRDRLFRITRPSTFMWIRCCRVMLHSCAKYSIKE